MADQFPSPIGQPPLAQVGDPPPELSEGQRQEQSYRSVGFTDNEILDWKIKKTDELKKANFGDDEIQKYFGVKNFDPAAMKQAVASNLQMHADAKSARDPIDVSLKPAPAEGFDEALAAAFGGTGVGMLLHGGNSPLSLTDHMNTMETIGSMIGSAAGDIGPMVGGWLAGATTGAPIGGAIGSSVGPVGTLGGIGVGAVVGGNAGAMAVPAVLRKLVADHYTKGDIETSGELMNRLAAASWEGIKQGTVGALVGGAGYGAKLATAGAAPLAAGTAAFTAELSTMATASAAMEKRLPNRSDFINAAAMMGPLHAIGVLAPKLLGIYKATGELPSEITDAAATDPVLKQELISDNPELPKIQVPTAEEQAKAGLPQFTDEDLKNGAKPTLEQAQAQKAIEVAKEVADAQAPKAPEEPELPPHDPTLEADQKEMLSYIGAHETPTADTMAGALKRDLVNFWRDEDTSRKGNASIQEGFNSEFGGKIWDKITNLYGAGFDYPKLYGKMLDSIGADPELKDNPQVLALLHSDVMGRVIGWVESETRDWKTQAPNGEGYDAWRMDYKKAFPEDKMFDRLRAYGMAQRILEKAKQGIKTIVNTGTNPDGVEMSPELAKRIVDADDGTLAVFNQRRINFRNRVLKYVHDSGYWTEKEFKAMLDQNENYMSFHRVQELDPLFGKAGGSSKGVFKFKGVGNLIVDPLISDLKDTQMLLKMAHENDVVRAAAKNLVTGEDDAFLRKVEPDIKPIKVQAAELSAEMDRQGIEHDPDSVSGMTVFRADKQRLGPRRAEYFEDGKRVVVEGAPETIDILNRVKGNPPVAGLFSQALRLAADGIRAGTINAWAFMTKHSFRNQLTGATNSETGVRPFIDTAMNALEFGQGKSQPLKDFYNSGGAQSSYLAWDDQYIKSRLYEIDHKTSFLEKAFNKVSTAIQMNHQLILANDNIIRFSEFKGMKAQGASDLEAGYAARRILPDVQTQGLKRAWLLDQTAFLGVHIKGLVREGEALMDQWETTKEAINQGNALDAIQGPVARSIKYITVPAALLAAANINEARLDRLLPWQKYGFFNWVQHDWQDASDAEASDIDHEDLKRQKEDGSWQIDKGTTFRMQMPFTQGIVFGALPQVALDSFKQKSPDAFYTWAKNIADSTVALPIPNVMAPMHAQYDNKNDFTGGMIIPDNKLKLAPELQYEPYTTETAKILGKMIGSVPYLGDIGPKGQKLSSPLVVEEYVRDWTGAVGMGILHVIDAGLKTAGVTHQAEKPAWEWADYPVVGAFAWRNGTAKTANIDNFLTRYEQASTNRASVKQYAKESEMGDPDAGPAGDRYADAHADQMAKASGTYKAIHNLKNAIQGITANPDYTKVEKRQLIDPLYYRMDEIAKQGLEQMDDFAKSVNDAKKGN